MPNTPSESPPRAASSSSPPGSSPATPSYDAVLVVSFGGPEGPDDVLAFMENVTRGRNIPIERLRQVSQHYALFGGVSPINAQNRALIAALERSLVEHGPHLPVYWGNRNWSPYLADTLERMRADGVTRAMAFVTSAFSSYSGCRQYREDIERARAEVGEDAPVVDKLRAFYNHPGFIEPLIDNVVAAVVRLAGRGNSADTLVFTAHSVPMAMADTSEYVAQLTEASRLVAEGVAGRLGRVHPWDLVFQSRSGAPGQPWLEPDVGDHLAALAARGSSGAVVVPVGFISDHMEVVYDLDTQAAETAEALGYPIERAATVGVAAPFVEMIRLLLCERIDAADGGAPVRLCMGSRGASHDTCPVDCCPPPLARRPA